MSRTTRTCYVYRSRRRADTYVFLAARDDFDRLPADLRRRLGGLEFAMQLTLHPERTLARASASTVLAALDDPGYYLQLPPPREPLLANDQLPV